MSEPSAIPSAAVRGPTAAQYRRTLVAWVIGALVPPLGLTFALVAAVAMYCGDRIDCSWGLEVLVFFPFVVICALTTGPLAVYLGLRWAGDPLAASTAGWTVLLAVPAVPLSVFVPMAGAWLPPLVGRHLALRRHPELRWRRRRA
ncbi:MAG: hypothetical protein ACRD0C_11440 [Acidimicrobiia bacterium]